MEAFQTWPSDGCMKMQDALLSQHLPSAGLSNPQGLSTQGMESPCVKLHVVSLRGQADACLQKRGMHFLGAAGLGAGGGGGASSSSSIAASSNRLGL